MKVRPGGRPSIMIGCAFRTFGCLTTLAAFALVSFFVLLTSPLETYNPSPDVRELVYPVALESLRSGAIHMLEPFAGEDEAAVHQFSEIQFDALIDSFLPDSEWFPIRNPTVEFREDEARVTMGISLGNVARFLLNMASRMEIDENVHYIVARGGKGAAPIYVRFGLNLTWHNGHPTLWVESLQFGKIAVGTIWLNDYIQPRLTPWLAEKIDAYMEMSPWRVDKTEFKDGVVVAQMNYVGLPASITEKIGDSNALIKFDSMAQLLGMKNCDHCNEEDLQEMQDMLRAFNRDPDALKRGKMRGRFQEFGDTIR